MYFLRSVAHCLVEYTMRERTDKGNTRKMKGKETLSKTLSSKHLVTSVPVFVFDFLFWPCVLPLEGLKVGLQEILSPPDSVNAFRAHVQHWHNVAFCCVRTRRGDLNQSLERESLRSPLRKIFSIIIKLLVCIVLDPMRYKTTCHSLLSFHLQTQECTKILGWALLLKSLILVL